MEKHCTASPIFPKCKKWNGDAELKGFVKCTDLRVGRIGPLSVAGHNLGASLRCSHAECRVRVRCTQMGKHCIVSPSFPKCKKKGKVMRS